MTLLPPSPLSRPMSRRLACCSLGSLFTGMLVAGHATAVRAQPVGPAPATTPGRNVDRVDLHHHFLPPAYVAGMGAERIGRPSPNGRVPSWTEEQSLAMMDRQGISKAILSISAPGVWNGDPVASAKLARASNEFAAASAARHPTRFGFFASLPLPDVQAALSEIAYTLDTLKADGIVMMTNYADRYLGDPAFAPVFDELNRRGTLVFLHPTDCNCARVEGVPASVVDFPHDTTRAVSSLLYAGTLHRNPRIRFVLSHAGGTLPFLAARIAGAAQFVPGVPKDVAATAMERLRTLHFDTALSINPVSLGALLKWVPSSQVVLGTDYPFAPEPMIAAGIQALAGFGLSADELYRLQGGTARSLLRSDSH